MSSIPVASEPGKAPTQLAPTPQLPSSVYKDEGVDTSEKALDRNELGEKNQVNQPAPSPSAAAPEPVATPVPEPATAPQPVTPAAEPPKLLAGKYKTTEELEKGYLESQKGFSAKVQAEVQKALPEAVNAALKEKGLQLSEQQQAANMAVNKPLTAMTDDEILDLQVKSPQDFVRKQREETLQAIRASQVQEQWRRDNKDLLDMKISDDEGEQFTGEFLVSQMTLALAQKQPDLLSDGTGEALLRAATGRVRNFIAGLQNQGKQQAMVVRETVTPLQATTASQAEAPGNAAPQPPAKNVDPADEEVERLRSEQRRTTGNRPVVRW